MSSQRTRMSHSIVTFSYLFLFSSLETFSLILDLFFRVSSFNICTLNIRFFSNPPYYTVTAIADLSDSQNINVFALAETWISPNTIPLLNYLMLYLMVTLPLTLLVLFLVHSLLQLLVVAQLFLSVKLAKVSPHRLLLLNHLNYPQSRSNLLTLIWL